MICRHTETGYFSLAEEAEAFDSEWRQKTHNYTGAHGGYSNSLPPQQRLAIEEVPRQVYNACNCSCVHLHVGSIRFTWEYLYLYISVFEYFFRLLI